MVELKLNDVLTENTGPSGLFVPQLHALLWELSSSFWILGFLVTTKYLVKSSLGVTELQKEERGAPRQGG